MQGKMPFKNMKEKFLSCVREQFSLRLHMTLILGSTIFCGFLFNVFLLYGFDLNMPIRYPLAVAFSYVAFLFWVKVWFELVTEPDQVQRLSTGDVFDTCDLLSNFVPDQVNVIPQSVQAPPQVSSTVSAGHSSPPSENGLSGWDLAGGLDEGAVILIVLGILFAMLFCLGGYLIYDAPAILSESMFELVLAAGVAKKMKQSMSLQWVHATISQTFPIFMFAVLISLAIGTVGAEACPKARKISEVISHCQKDPRHVCTHQFTAERDGNGTEMKKTASSPSSPIMSGTVFHAPRSS